MPENTTSTSFEFHTNAETKIILQVSKTDGKDQNKRSYFDITCDSPFQILSCHATQANTFVPAYENSTPGHKSATREIKKDECGCALSASHSIRDRQDVAPNFLHLTSTARHAALGFTARRSCPPATSSTPQPGQGSVTTTGNFVRQDSSVPPPLVSPPPGYTPTVGNNDDAAALQDYFSRLSFS